LIDDATGVLVKYQRRNKLSGMTSFTVSSPQVDMELVARVSPGVQQAAPASGEDELLAKFIDRHGREKVLAAEPGPRGLSPGETVYVDDKSCGANRIREVIGAGGSSYGADANMRPRQSRCISLTE
jgi:hypothetical protein